MAFKGLDRTAQDIWQWMFIPLFRWLWRVTYEIQPQDVIAGFYIVASPVMAILHFSGQEIGLSYLDSIGFPWWLQIGTFLVAGWVLIHDQPAWAYMAACIPSVGYACGLVFSVYTGAFAYASILAAIYLFFWAALAVVTIRLRYEMRRLMGLYQQIEMELERDGRRTGADSDPKQSSGSVPDWRVPHQPGT